MPYAIRLLWSANKARTDEKKAEYFGLARDFRETLSVGVCRPHFLGVWDTVSSVGWIANPLSLPYTHSLPDVAIVRHAVSIVEVSIARSGDACTVAVRDDGPGLPVGAEHQVFERFVSLDGHGGSGLGLAIARALAERQEGALRYVDRSFVMSLPAA